MKISRRQQILETLAKMLKDSPGERISTLALAKEVGFSEAALYRHFPSKAKMFEGLIEFIEDTIFAKITIILAQETSTQKRCEQVVWMLLMFAEHNPGLSRLLVGDVLIGETERLRKRITYFFDRVETQLRQLLSEAELRKELRLFVPAAVITQLLMAYIDGCIVQFVRSEFHRSPTLYWLSQWQVMAPSLLWVL